MPQLAVTLLLLAAALPARAEERIHIDIRGSAGRDYQVAVQEFAAEGDAEQLREAFHAALVEGLNYSGLLKVVPPEAFLESEKTLDFDSSAINCENWRGIGADALVQGRLELNGSRLRAHVKIWDTIRCRMQGKRARKDGDPDQHLLLARALADDVVMRFTGRRGVVSTQIAFVSDTRGNKEVFLMEADGSNKRRVTGNGAINLFPGWSSDANSLVYTSFKEGRPDLWLIFRGPRKGAKLLDQPYDKYRGVWAPTGGSVAVVMNPAGNTDIYTVDPRGAVLERLTNGRSIETSPAWSPDAKKMAFVSDRSGAPQIYIKDLKTGRTRRITYEGNYNASPAWSPTGEWIVYSARTGSSFDLYLIDPESGYTTPLVLHPRSDEDPAWAPDGRKIVFSSTRRGRYDLYRIDVDGGNLVRLTEDFGSCTNPAWSTWPN
jgi:TolB protein